MVRKGHLATSSSGGEKRKSHEKHDETGEFRLQRAGGHEMPVSGEMWKPLGESAP